MHLPAIRGIIERRMLVNFRVDPQVIASVLPPPFRPKLHHGHAIAGICLIRLRAVRPRCFPAILGLSSENAAHRIAVEWDGADGNVRQGVYIPRRDSSSRFNSLAGGKLFPGIQQHAVFDVHETETDFDISVRSDDGRVSVCVESRLDEKLPEESVFSTLDEASKFFEGGSLGYSATHDDGRFDGMELRCDQWEMEPLTVSRVESSFFSNEELFPAGSAQFDCALLMRNIHHEWHSEEEICCSVSA